VGFNASHSMGLILFGLVFGFLAWAHDLITSTTLTGVQFRLTAKALLDAIPATGDLS